MDKEQSHVSTKLLPTISSYVSKLIWALSWKAEEGVSLIDTIGVVTLVILRKFGFVLTVWNQNLGLVVLG